MVTFLHATHLRCSRETGVCTIDAHGTWIEARHRTVPIADINAMDVVVVRGRNPYALARLKTKSGVVDLAGPMVLGRFSPSSARDAKTELDGFLATPTKASLDVWITQGFTYVGIGILAAMLVGLSVFLVKATVLTRCEVRIEVDPARKTVHIDDEDVAFADIEAVRLELGARSRTRAWRIAVQARGKVLYATDFLPGNDAGHEGAMFALREAVGLRAI